MDGTASWSLARKETTHTENHGKEFHHKAAAGWENKDDTKALKGCEQNPRFPRSIINYGRSMQGREDNAAITARYRYHVTVFQNMAYLVLLDKLSKVQEPHKQQVAASLALPEDVLYALDVLESVQGRDDDYANAYKSAFGWVKTVWDAIVQGLGLSTKEYEALVEFKKKGVIINEYEEDDQEEEAKAKESLQALQSSTAPVLVAYKEPLTRLLQVLLGA